jgi:hypothetical protein
MKMKDPSDIIGLDVQDLPLEALLELAQIYLGLAFSHYGLWAARVSDQVGPDATARMEPIVSSIYFPRVIDRLFPYLNRERVSVPGEILSGFSKEEALFMVEAIAKTWLTGDGVWFRQVEMEYGMEMAKKINDACWRLFCALEAAKIKEFLNLGASSGLEGLDAALKLRIYSSFNSHQSEWDDQGALIFRMTACRVQTTRRGKGLEDYPCQSAGIAEYSGFASGIDPEIKTHCVSCPPVIESDKGFCIWRFTI